MNQKRDHDTAIFAVLLVCLLGFTSCPYQQPVLINCKDTHIPPPATDTLLVYSDEQEDTEVLQSEVYIVNYIPGRIELPEIKNMQWFIQHLAYALEYDTAQRHSLWVAYKFYSDYNQKNCNRSDAWAFDPKIPKEFQSLNGPKQTFAYAGCDRGHLCASEDRVFNLNANQETFYYSNMSPQMSCFNQGIWKGLEEAVRKWAQGDDCDTLYVATGGAINPDVETFGTLEDRNNVTIPKYYFKALVKRKGDTFDGIAFCLENRCYTNEKGKNITKITHEYSMSIRELEEITKINFFPYLRHVMPDNPMLEDEVETTLDISKWPL